MPTKFETIYERAVFKITDYSFIDSNKKIKETVLQQYLMSSIVDFQHACKFDISKYDLGKQEFSEELDNEAIEVLAVGITYYWLKSKLLNTELLRNTIHNKDYVSYSPANLLKQIQEVKEDVEAEYKGKINTYSFRYGNIENLKVRGD